MKESNSMKMLEKKFLKYKKRGGLTCQDILTKQGLNCIRECGCSITLGCKTRHEKTEKHFGFNGGRNSQL